MTNTVHPILGCFVRDTLTGFEGIATGRSEYMYGCAQVAITPDKLGPDGKPIQGEWFDEQRVALVDQRPIRVSETSTATSGGPQRNAAPIR